MKDSTGMYLIAIVCALVSLLTILDRGSNPTSRAILLMGCMWLVGGVVVKVIEKKG